MTNIIAAMIRATTTNEMIRLILLTSPHESGTRQPRQLANPTTLASGDEYPMNFVPFSVFFLANFVELRLAELPRILIPRTWVNKAHSTPGSSQ
jgi:hypothetical protein